MDDWTSFKHGHGMAAKPYFEFIESMAATVSVIGHSGERALRGGAGLCFWCFWWGYSVDRFCLAAVEGRVDPLFLPLVAYCVRGTK